jgi:hypothetical protein
MSAPGDLIARHREKVFTRLGIDQLGPHIAEAYGVDVTGTEKLDAGVVRIDLAGRPSWIARVFGAARNPDAAKNDVAVLRRIAAFDFPAERPADDQPLSTLDGQQVLVTTFVEGGNGRGDRSVDLSRSQGDLLGRLHALPTSPPSFLSSTTPPPCIHTRPPLSRPCVTQSRPSTPTAIFRARSPTRTSPRHSLQATV